MINPEEQELKKAADDAWQALRVSIKELTFADPKTQYAAKLNHVAAWDKYKVAYEKYARAKSYIKKKIE